jgi:phosphonate metabolism protein PhnN/1,5-bisphosphokinase (PRPP-forming)
MSGGEVRRLPEPGPLSSGGFAETSIQRRGARLDRSGILVLVVGPSGAGKDTLLNAARAHFQSEDSIVFCERLITRDDQTGEKHAAVSAADFARLRETGALFLSWEAHGLQYGVAAAAFLALRSGKTVIVNVSRHIIETARQRWANTHVVYVTASEEARRQRLLARGRESAADIDSRLKRGRLRDCPEADWVSWLDNSGDLADGIARFNALIAELAMNARDSGPEF